MAEAKVGSKAEWVQYAVTLLAWAASVGLAYIGLIFLLFGDMIGSRGSIDYVDFSEAQKRGADTEAVYTHMFGIPLLCFAAVVALRGRRIGRWVRDRLVRSLRERSKPSKPSLNRIGIRGSTV
jgi:hypothetical protein